MSKKKRTKKSKCKNVEVWTEQHEEYLKEIYGMDFIAGFTENGVPYGTFIDENDENDEIIIQYVTADPNDDLPF